MHQPSPSTNVYDDLPADVPLGAFQTILDYFGLHETFDANGNKKWTISIQRAPLASLPQDAIFEQSTRTWRLRDRYTALDVMKDPPASPPPVPPASTEVTTGATTADQSPTESATTDTISTDARNDTRSVPSPFDAPDWVSTLPKTPHTEFFRSIDWSTTKVGSLLSWPRSLRLYTHMLLSQQTPAAVYWGPEHTSIYNEGLVPLIGKAHPTFMGAAFLDTWAELKSSFVPIFDQIHNDGIGIDLSDYNIFLSRNNYVEETWWRGNLFPLAQEDGTVGGCCFMWNEVTRQVLNDRRTKLLNDLGQFDITREDVWEHITKTLRRNPRDIAMAILYSSDDARSNGDRILRSQGAIGVGTNHVAAPEVLNLDKSNSGFAPAMRKALDSPMGWIAVERQQENFPTEVLEGVDWQGYGEHSNDLVIIPLEVVNNYLKGFVILGMNPRRAFDADHRQFVTDMQRQLVTIMTSITTAEQAKQRESQLMQELAESERRIRQLAEMAPMGLFDLSAEGRMRWANNHYFSIMGLDRPKNIAETAWIEPVDPIDLQRVESIFRSCIENDKELAGTVRLRKKWHPPQAETGGEDAAAEHIHVYFQAFSYKEDGVTTSIMGSVTDVSRFVWAESVQARVAHDAQRARQRQEEFIDVVSHELRNPLSAVTQCADSIIQSLRELRAIKSDMELEQIVESCSDAADSILLCATHQKRIVDDVLTLSKLDSELITLAPTAFQPVAIQKEAMQMFQSEFAANKIAVSVQTEEHTYSPTDTLLCDPARLSQVLVNLLTNAIKFQKADGDPQIHIQYGISSQPPPATKFGNSFHWSNPTHNRYPDFTLNDAYGTGDVVYLYLFPNSLKLTH